MFQFHYGTIKRSRSGYVPSPSGVSQFHYGTIKSPEDGSFGLNDMVSIPLWYD